MIEMLVGHAAGSSVKYVQESARPVDPSGITPVVAYLTERPWDVTDPQARLDAATREIGPITEDNRLNAQWFIDEKRNAAVLLVYRPSSFQRDESAPRWRPTP